MSTQDWWFDSQFFLAIYSWTYLQNHVVAPSSMCKCVCVCKKMDVMSNFLFLFKTHVARCKCCKRMIQKYRYSEGQFSHAYSAYKKYSHPWKISYTLSCLSKTRYLESNRSRATSYCTVIFKSFVSDTKFVSLSDSVLFFFRFFSPRLCDILKTIIILQVSNSSIGK